MHKRPKPRTAKSCFLARVRLNGETLEERLAFSAGAIDTTFNGTGLASIHPGAAGFVDEGASVATQADGKVVVAGTAWDANSKISFALVRYNTDGSLDTTFGNNGQVITPVTTSIQQGRIYGLIVEPDQKIVVSGEDGSNMEVARYNTDGSLDSTFGTGGIVTVPSIGANFSDGKGESLAVQADGKYVITGQSISLQFQDTWPLVRLNHDGSVDTSFGAAGLGIGPTFPAIGGLADAWDVLVQPDQKIVVAGDQSDGQQWDIVRYNSDGTLDSTFGTGGVATVSFSAIGQTPFRIAQQADGKLLIAGTPFENGSESQPGFELTRLNTDGSIDSTFNGGQPIVIGIPGQANSLAFQVAVQGDGQILLGGIVSAMAGSGLGNFAVQRYNTDGTLDTTFGNAGTAMTTFNETFNNWGLDYSDERMGMAIEPNGAIVVMSEGQLTLNDQDFSWVLARFTGDKTTPSLTVSDAGGTYTGGLFPATATVNGGSSLEGVTPTLAYYIGPTTTGAPSSVPPISAGTYTVVANFAGSADFLSASSDPVTFNIAKATAAVTVSNPGGTFNGNPFPATATVKGLPSLEGVSPTLAYYVGSNTLGTPSSTPPSAAGTYTVVANFPGSTDYAAASSNPLTFNIGQAVPVVTVSDAGGTFNGNPFPATATVNGGTSLEGVSPTFAYYVGSTTTSTPSSTAPTAAGTYTVVANYPGSLDYSAASSSPVTFNIGQATLTVAITQVTPNPRSTNVSTMTITFSGPVTGFSLSNLQLSQNGDANLLTGSQTLTTSDNTIWTLRNLAGLTSSSGSYVLTLSPFGIEGGVNSSMLVSGASSSFVVTAPRQNTSKPLDVNNDGSVTPIDALIVINNLNSQGSGNNNFIDVNGDGVVTPLDALIVINFLDSQIAAKQTVVSAIASDNDTPPATNNTTPPATVATADTSLKMGVSLSTAAQAAAPAGNSSSSPVSVGASIGTPAESTAASASLNQAAPGSNPSNGNRRVSTAAAETDAIDAVLSEPLLEW